MKDINISSTDLGILAVCALRYCYDAPLTLVVADVIRPYLSKLKTTDLWVMIEDCEVIDEPWWNDWKEEIEEELERRRTNDERND